MRGKWWEDKMQAVVVTCVVTWGAVFGERKMFFTKKKKAETRE